MRPRKFVGVGAIGLLGVGLAGLFVACVLNPHPLPPLEATSADAGAKGSPSADASPANGSDGPEAPDALPPWTDMDAGPRDAAGDGHVAATPDGSAAEGGLDAGDATAADASDAADAGAD